MLWNYFNTNRQNKEMNRLAEAGIEEKLMDHAVTWTLLELIFGHKQEGIVCVEQPGSLMQMEFLARIFPNSRFIHVVRDGRAVSNALLNDQNAIDITNGNPPFIKFTRFEQALSYWNSTVNEMDRSCKLLKNRCVTVRYEDLEPGPSRKSLIHKLKRFLPMTNPDKVEKWQPNILTERKFNNLTVNHTVK